MEAISPSVWFPVVTLVIGLLLKAVFDSWTENRRASFDRESRIEKRKEVILLQRMDLQRKALGDLQVAIADMMRSTSLIQGHDVAVYRETKEWGRNMSPDGVSEAARANFRSVSLMRVRVSDEDVRNMTGELSTLCTQVTRARSEEDSDRSLHLAAILYNSTNERIGEVLRALEHQEQAFLS
jgi:hypothetical protein